MIFVHTKWSDVAVISFAGESFLIQGRKNKFTRASKFRLTPFRQSFSCNKVTHMKQEWLEKAKLWEIN